MFACVELNSTFYRAHRKTTYERWAASVPEDFRYSLKLPKQITHERRLRDCGDLLEAFLSESAALGHKRSVLLAQLPPSLAFDNEAAVRFFATLRASYDGNLACEPRHASWFEARADALLRSFGVARVAADPALVPEAARPGAARTFAYYRWHGTPRTYYSAYDFERIATLAASVERDGTESWCIFDNTAAGAAITNALQLKALCERPSQGMSMESQTGNSS